MHFKNLYIETQKQFLVKKKQKPTSLLYKILLCVCVCACLFVYIQVQQI